MAEDILRLRREVLETAKERPSLLKVHGGTNRHVDQLQHGGHHHRRGQQRQLHL